MKNSRQDKIKYYTSIKDCVQRQIIMDMDESFRTKERLIFKGGDHEVNNIYRILQRIEIKTNLLNV